jgi:hypothetical protein
MGIYSDNKALGGILIYKLGSCYKIKYYDNPNTHMCYIKIDDKIEKPAPPQVSQNMPLFIVTSTELAYRAGQQKSFQIIDSQHWLGMDISLHSKTENKMSHPTLNKNFNVE